MQSLEDLMYTLSEKYVNINYLCHVEMHQLRAIPRHSDKKHFEHELVIHKVLYQVNKKLSDWVEVLLYVHRNHRFIRDGSPGHPPQFLHSSWALKLSEIYIYLMRVLSTCRYSYHNFKAVPCKQICYLVFYTQSASVVISGQYNPMHNDNK